jgi:hypothetical protein
LPEVWAKKKAASYKREIAACAARTAIGILPKNISILQRTQRARTLLDGSEIVKRKYVGMINLGAVKSLSRQLAPVYVTKLRVRFCIQWFH